MLKRSGKVVIFLLILLCALSIGLAGYIYMVLEKEKSQNAALSEDLKRIESEKMNASEEAEKYKSELKNMQEKLSAAERQIKELTFSLDDLKRKENQAGMEMESLKKDLLDAKNTKIAFEEQVSSAAGEINRLKEQLAALEKEKAEFEKKNKEPGSSGVQLGKIVVAHDAAEGPGKMKVSAAHLEGEILAVNNDYEFVVINLGLRDGVSSGDVFSVYQKNKYLGDVGAEKVDEAMSSANFLEGSLKNKIRQGDTVKTK